jgi:hypothetical protein
MKLLLSTCVLCLPFIAAAAQSSSPGMNHAVGYYDSRLQRVVMVAGAEAARAGEHDRVFSWSGARWELVTDSGPPSRGNAGAAYDAQRAMAVVTGGGRYKANSSAFETIAQTWIGPVAGWQRISGTEIVARDHNALVYDEARGHVITFGGMLADRSWPGDTWELRADGWTRIATHGPASRARTALAYDNVRRHVVLFGGVGAQPGPGQPQPFFNDTWAFENGTWRKLADGGPRARYAHGMAFDERAGVLLLYSGAAAHRDAPLSDMWRWDGNSWIEIPLTGPTPGYRYQPVMVYDRARGKTVLFGGIGETDNSTWEWDGTRWTQIRP